MEHIPGDPLFFNEIAPENPRNSVVDFHSAVNRMEMLPDDKIIIPVPIQVM